MTVYVNGVAITDEQVSGEMDRIRADYLGYMGRNGGEASESHLREWAEENLIEDELLRQEAVATQPVPSDERAARWVAEHAERYEAFPEGERLARAKDEMRIRRFEKELRKRVPQASEEDARREYDANADLYVAPEVLRLSHICRLTGSGWATNADGYLDLLRIKADLASGQMGWFEAVKLSDTYEKDGGMFDPVIRGEMPAEIEEKLFALKTGEVSDVMDLGGRSLHVFRALAFGAPEKVPFEAIRERIPRILFERAYLEALEKTFDDLKAKAAIRREA